MENISIDELHSRIDNLNDQQLILDVRSAEEFNEGHIAGAQNTPHEEVGSIVEDLKKFETVYVHCKMGGASQNGVADSQQFRIGQYCLRGRWGNAALE